LFERFVGEPFGLRKVEFSLLLLVLTNRAIPPKQLARALAVTAPTLTLLLDRLQQRGLLRREPNPRDGRSQNVVLTEAGQRLAEDAAAASAPMESGLRERLSPAEQAMLIELLEKLGG
jgi:MarR family transcriptional regulator for hemolysin